MYGRLARRKKIWPYSRGDRKASANSIQLKSEFVFNPNVSNDSLETCKTKKMQNKSTS